MSETEATSANDAGLRRTALHGQHVKLGARLVPFAGWEMPVQYSGIKDEHLAVRERAGLFDVSHMGQIQLTGKGAAAYLEKLLTCVVSTLGVGRARYGLMLDERGGCLDDVMLTRVAEETWFLCVNASNVDKCREWIQAHRPPQVKVEDRSRSTSLLALQGPAARGILERLHGGDAPLPKRFRVATCELAGVTVLASGTGYTGSPGFELYLERRRARALRSDPRGRARPTACFRPASVRATPLRLEAALPLYGHELDATTSPFEAGLDRFVKPLETGFIGAEALAGEARRGRPAPPRRLRNGRARNRPGRLRDPSRRRNRRTRDLGRALPDPRKVDRPRLRSASLGEIGQLLEIRVRNKDVAARVVETPFRVSLTRTESHRRLRDSRSKDPIPSTTGPTHSHQGDPSRSRGYGAWRTTRFPKSS